MTLATERFLRPRTPGWVQYLNQRMPGETPHDADDFFTDGTFSGWTILTVTGGQTITEARSVCSVSITSTIDSGDTNAALRAVTPSTGHTIETRFSALNEDSTSLVMGGLVWADGTTSTSNASIIEVHHDGTQGTWVVTGRAGTFTNAGAVVGPNLATNSPNDYLYVRLQYSAANTFAPFLSVDGVTWKALSTIADTNTPTHVGFFWSTFGQAVTLQTVTYDYFRYNA